MKISEFLTQFVAGRYSYNIKLAIFQLMSRINLIFSISCEIALMYMLKDLTDD